jgi:thiosulfate/3-mercaptopyruvate sulfurtransferase
MRPVPTDVLVTADWLAQRLADVRVLDVRGAVLAQEPRYHADPVAYRAGHIPGAAFVDWRSDLTDRADPVPVQLAPPDAFAADATRLGIGNDTVVVAYDDYRNVLAGRVVWALRTYGHRRAHVLDGGLRAWTAAGHALAEGAEQPAPADPPYRTGERRPTLWTLDDVQVALDRDVLILDARAHDEYAGIESHARRHGHVPGAVNVPYRELLAADGTFRSPEELRQAFADAGVDVTAIRKPVVVYCNGGVSATAVANGLALAGGPDAAVYDGSWNEWGNRSDTPIEN